MFDFFFSIILPMILAAINLALCCLCLKLYRQRNVLHKAFYENYGMWDTLPKELGHVLNQIEGYKNKKEK